MLDNISYNNNNNNNNNNSEKQPLPFNSSFLVSSSIVSEKMVAIQFPFDTDAELVKCCVSVGDSVDIGDTLAIFKIKSYSPPTPTTPTSDQQQSSSSSNNSSSSSSTKTVSITSDYDGIVRSILDKSVKQIKKGDKLFNIEHCSHEVQFKGLCATCGRDLSEKKVNKDAGKPILHGHSHLTVSHGVAQKIENDNAKRLLSHRKLSLVLDIDHTIIHAIMEPHFMEVPYWRNIDCEKENIRSITLGNMKYYIKLRPFLYKFLEDVNRKFELHIYTMGTRSYALEIAKLIDEKQDLFKERILSRDDTTDMSFKTLQRLFPCDDSMVLIVDDRSDVWKRSKNLVQISPYLYFVGCKDMVNLLPSERHSPHQTKSGEAGKDEKKETEAGAEGNKESSEENKENKENKESSEENKEVKEEIKESKEVVEEGNGNKDKIEIGNGNGNNNNNNNDERNINISSNDIKNDRHLLTVWNQLSEVHRIYYEEYDKGNKLHVADVLSIVKKKILKGVNIVFSGVYPLQLPPHKQPLRLLAEELGAVVQNDITSSTTHVVAARKGTTKVHKAISKGLRIVNQNWIEQSAFQWQRLDEEDFPVPGDDPKEVESVPPKSAEKLDNIISTHIDELKKTFDDADAELNEFLEGEDDSSASENGSNISEDSDRELVDDMDSDEVQSNSEEAGDGSDHVGSKRKRNTNTDTEIPIKLNRNGKDKKDNGDGDGDQVDNEDKEQIYMNEKEDQDEDEPVEEEADIGEEMADDDLADFQNMLESALDNVE